MTKRINIDKRIYDRFYAAPNSPSYVCSHILAEYLEVPVGDLIAALERHGFTSEPVTHEGHDYLKLTRSDGVDFTADWNHAGSNYYDGLDIETGTMSELRWLPYQLQDPTLFCALWWSRKAVSGEQLPRLTRAWSLMESKGQDDISPAVKEARAEKAEKERLAGLDAENAKLKETVERLRATLPHVSQNRLLRSTESTPCCGEIPWLDTWDAKEAQSVHCLMCGRHTDSYLMRSAALDAWEGLSRGAVQDITINTVEAFFTMAKNPDRHTFVSHPKAGPPALLDLTGNIRYLFSVTFVKEKAKAPTLRMLASIKGREELADLITSGRVLDIQ